MVGPNERLTATPDTCFWGYVSADEHPVVTVDPGASLTIEAITHHAGDAPDLMMDPALDALWAGIPEHTRAPGVHILTGPVAVHGAAPGDALRVDLVSMRPRHRFGANCAANWGLFHGRAGKERITIYELDDGGPDGFPCHAHPRFGFDFTTRAVYDLPGVVTPPDATAREPFGRDVAVPVRPHLGVMGVAPAEPGVHSSIPPGVFGGNVDNWRFGPGATVFYPVAHEGARFFIGDPHFAQGDGEICGTAIEASLDVDLRLDVVPGMRVRSPLLHHDGRWYTHGFGDGVDGLGEAMTMAAELLLELLVDHAGFTFDEAYSLASVAMDLGVTQVVDGTVGCHAGIPASILDPAGTLGGGTLGAGSNGGA